MSKYYLIYLYLILYVFNNNNNNNIFLAKIKYITKSNKRIANSSNKYMLEYRWA